MAGAFDEVLETGKVVSLLPQENAMHFEPSAFVYRDPATIPRRDFLYGFELRRKQLSMVVAPGAAGKTTLKVGRALCMVLGRDLLGHRVWNGPHRVWLWNLEDEVEECEKTVHAFLKLWNIDPADLDGRLFVDGVDSPGSPLLKLARAEDRNGARLQVPVVEGVVEAMLRRKIDYLDVDPFVSSHAVEENDNAAIDLVAKAWVKVAARTNAAVCLAHHIRKPSSAGGDSSAYDARGAGAAINAARSVLVINPMSKDAAELCGIQPCDRKRFISVYDDKNNKAPPALKAHWFEFVGVDLGNGDDTGPADSIGALQPWIAPDAFGGVTARQLFNIQTLIANRPNDARDHSQATAWVGKLIALVLDMNLDFPGDVARIKLFQKTWKETGSLRTVERPDAKSEMRTFVEVGVWAVPD